jgi:hypothetical protein
VADEDGDRGNGRLQTEGAKGERQKDYLNKTELHAKVKVRTDGRKGNRNKLGLIKGTRLVAITFLEG